MRNIHDLRPRDTLEDHIRRAVESAIYDLLCIEAPAEGVLAALVHDALLHSWQVTGLTALSHKQLDHLVSEQKFPQPVELEPWGPGRDGCRFGTRLWLCSEVQRWILQRIAERDGLQGVRERAVAGTRLPSGPNGRQDETDAGADTACDVAP